MVASTVNSAVVRWVVWLVACSVVYSVGHSAACSVLTSAAWSDFGSVERSDLKLVGYSVASRAGRTAENSEPVGAAYSAVCSAVCSAVVSDAVPAA